MPSHDPPPGPRPKRVLVAVSRFNEGVTRRLLDGAVAALGDAGVNEDDVDTVWVPGAFELPVVVQRGLATGRYTCAVALGAVIRGDTPHFDYVCSETTRGLGEAARSLGIPVGFGLLTCDDLTQAMARAGGAAGNKGRDAVQAALATVDVLERIDPRATS